VLCCFASSLEILQEGVEVAVALPPEAVIVLNLLLLNERADASPVLVPQIARHDDLVQQQHVPPGRVLALTFEYSYLLSVTSTPPMPIDTLTFFSATLAIAPRLSSSINYVKKKYVMKWERVRPGFFAVSSASRFARSLK